MNNQQQEFFNIHKAGFQTIIEPNPAPGKKTNTINNHTGLPPPPMVVSGASQSAEILAYLQTGRSITPLEALNKFGCFRLGARCWDLRKAGYEIKSEMIEEHGKRFAKYSLEK